jgi:hypothetical protein
LTSVTLQSATPPKLGEDAFVYVSNNCTFFCPVGVLSVYQADEDWAPYFGGGRGREGTAVQAVGGGSGESSISLYDLRGQLRRRAVVTLPASPSALRTVLGVPAGLYILATPAGTQKIQL